MFKIELKRRRLLKRRTLPGIVLPKLWKLPQCVLLAQRMLPQIDLPRVLIVFPEAVTVPWREMKIERVGVVPLKPGGLRNIFRRISTDERQIE